MFYNHLLCLLINFFLLDYWSFRGCILLLYWSPSIEPEIWKTPNKYRTEWETEEFLIVCQLSTMSHKTFASPLPWSQNKLEKQDIGSSCIATGGGWQQSWCFPRASWSAWRRLNPTMAYKSMKTSEGPGWLWPFLSESLRYWRFLQSLPFG